MSQDSFQVPTGGSESAVTFAGQCNLAWKALASKNSGPSAPANGPGSLSLTFQDWMDTTNASFPVYKINDGTNFDRVGTLDVANSIFCPQLGGGLGSVASASSVDLGLIPQTLVAITAANTIASFGSSAKTGEMKVIYCGGNFTLTNSSTMICPGGQDLGPVDVGDTFWAVYDGSGVWLILNHQKVFAGSGMSKPTGELFFMYGTGAVPGAVRANGRTIGNAGSNATEASGTKCFKLFKKIWDESASDTEILFYTSGAVLTTRGATAAADWAALKQITVPDMRGRVPVGLDDMGNSAATRLTSSTMSPDGVTLGCVGGSQRVTLSQGNHANVTLTTSVVDTRVWKVVGLPVGSQGNSTNTGGFGYPQFQATDWLVSVTSGSISATTPLGGSATPFNNLPPSKGLTAYFAL